MRLPTAGRGLAPVFPMAWRLPAMSAGLLFSCLVLGAAAILAGAVLLLPIAILALPLVLGRTGCAATCARAKIPARLCGANLHYESMRRPAQHVLQAVAGVQRLLARIETSFIPGQRMPMIQSGRRPSRMAASRDQWPPGAPGSMAAWPRPGRAGLSGETARGCPGS